MDSGAQLLMHLHMLHEALGESWAWPSASSGGGKDQEHTPAFTALGHELLCLIVGYMDSTSRAALLRTCRMLRDIVLGRTATIDSGKRRPQTHLFFNATPQGSGPGSQLQKLLDNVWGQAGPDPWACFTSGPGALKHIYQQRPEAVTEDVARRALQLAASSTHDVHLHVRPAGSSSSSLQPWLATLLQPCTAAATAAEERPSSQHTSAPEHAPALVLHAAPLQQPAVSLQHLTNIWLQNMQLDHPMPDFIGKACPGLQAYHLHSVWWQQAPVHTAKRRKQAAAATQHRASTEQWPQLTHLTLSGCRQRDLEQWFNTTTLPNLTSFTVLYTRDMQPLPAAQCIKGFGSQLSALHLGTVNEHTRNSLDVTCERKVWLAFDHIFSEEPGRPLIRPTNVGLHVCMHEADIKKIVHRIPALKQLAVWEVKLYGPIGQCSWDLEQLHISCVTPSTMASLARLPSMPQLMQITVGCNGEPFLVRRIEVARQQVAPNVLASLVVTGGSISMDCSDQPELGLGPSRPEWDMQHLGLGIDDMHSSDFLTAMICDDGPGF